MMMMIVCLCSHLQLIMEDVVTAACNRPLPVFDSGLGVDDHLGRAYMKCRDLSILHEEDVNMHGASATQTLTEANLNDQLSTTSVGACRIQTQIRTTNIISWHFPIATFYARSRQPISLMLVGPSR